MTEPKVFKFEAEVNQVLSLVVNSLYKNQEIFLRELISNASDALDKLRFQSLQRPDLTPVEHQPRIRIEPDKEHRTVTISDNGIGMTAAELERNLGRIAWSGSREFLDRLKNASSDKNDVQLIGQFGVGFYASFLVASRVEVISRAAGSEKAFRWASEGKDGFSLEPASRDGIGTSVILHLKEEAADYVEPHRLKALVSRYSDYIGHPIELSEETEGGRREFRTINQGQALWQRSPKEISKEQYVEFYKHLGHDWEEPLAWKHFQIEGTQLFTGLLFVPRRAPFDLFQPDPKHGLKLHVQRVLVIEHCDELLPRWLRFIKGIIDTEDLPLNVSRELLQDSKAVRIIRKQVVQQSLDCLEELAEERPEDYEKFWKTFGVVLKEGFHFEPEYKDRLAKLVRYESSRRPELVSLAEYCEGMKENQPAIYYASGLSRQVIESSPHLEALRKRDYEVLIMSDPVDPFAVSALGEYAGHPLVSAMDADLKLDSDKAAPDSKSTESGDRAPILDRFSRILGDKVEKVIASSRLTDSPACLVVQKGGIEPHIERLMRAQQLDAPISKRILELNLDHPVMRNLAQLDEQQPGSERVQDWVHMIYEQALVAEGSPLQDPAAFAQRLSRLMSSAAKAELDPGQKEQGPADRSANRD